MVPGPGSPTNEDLTMNDPDDDLRQQIALFRYSVIADLVHLPVGTPGTGAMKRAKAEKTYTIPGTTRTRVARRDHAALDQRLPAAAASTRSTPSPAPTGGSPGGFRPRSQSGSSR